MDNSQIVYIAIFGLSLRSLHHLKEVTEAVIPDDVFIHWTNISDPKLNWLLISDTFFDSPNIQRLLQNKKIKLLQLTKDYVSSENELKFFNIDQMKRQQLRHWMMNNIYEMKVVDNVREKKYHSLNEDLTQTDHDIKKMLAQLVNPLNGRIKIFDREGEIALCDLGSQWVWTDYRSKKTDQSLNYTHSTVVEILNHNAKQQHFKLWLWNLIWNSPELVVMPPEQGYLKLNIWPQPILGESHREILKMSAWFAKGATIRHVAEKVNLPVGTVQHFVYASLITGFIEYTAAPFHDHIEVADNLPLQENLSGIKKFFNGIRRRFGL